MAIVRATKDLRAELAAMPGVERVQPAIEDDAKVVDGLDRLVVNVRNLRSRVGLNGNLGLLPEAEPGDVPAYPCIDFSGQRALVDMDHRLHLPTRYGALGAINLSLGPIEFATYREADPVNAATRIAAKDAVVVAAAGNHGTDPSGEETLSAWAQPPWVVSVGATNSADGGAILEQSSRGSEDDPLTWPDLVSHGVSRLDEGKHGTSFAAPRVTRQVAILASFVLALRSFALPRLGADEEGVPPAWAGFVDTGIDSRPSAAERPLSALPRNMIDHEALADAVETLKAAGAPPDLCPRTDAIRGILLGSASPLPDVARHKQGKGFVSDATTERAMAGFTGADLARWFCGAPQLDDSAQRRLDGMRFVDERGAAALVYVVAISLELIAIDIAAYENPAAPRPAAGPPEPSPSGAQALWIAREG